MPLLYRPYRLTSAPLASASTYAPDSDHDDEPIPVPSPSHPGSEEALQLSDLADLPDNHAVHATAYFPTSTDQYGSGFVLVRAVAGGHELELRWCRLSSHTAKTADESSFAPTLDNLRPPPPPKTFIFPAPLLSNVGVFADKLSGHLHVLAVTMTGFLYRLTFPLPYLFNSSSLKPGWSSEYAISHFAGLETSHSASSSSSAKTRAPSETFIEDAGLVLVACRDGTLVKLIQNRSADGSGFERNWRESVLRPTSFLSGVSRLFSRSTSSSSSFDGPLAPTHALSAASFIGGSGYALTFVVSPDRKLRIWNLASETCIRTMDLPVYFPPSSESERGLVLAGQEAEARLPRDSLPPLSFDAKPLLKLFSPTDDDQNGYPKYLLAYIPAPLPSGNMFALYGIELEESKSSSGGVGEVTLLWEKSCDLETRGKGVELRDVAIAPLSSSSDQGWALWTLWDAGNGPLVKYTRLGDEPVPGADDSVANISLGAPTDLSQNDWRTVSSKRAFRPVHGDSFEEVLEAATATSQHNDPSDVFLSRVLEPGRFSESTLRLALQNYREVVPSTSRQPSNLFATLAEEIGIIVASNCQLETDPKTGGQLYDKLYSSIVREWSRFIGIAEQIEASAMWPVQLSLPLIEGAESAGAVSTPIVITRAAIAVPSIEDSASIIQRIRRAEERAHASLKSKAASANTELERIKAERKLLFSAADSDENESLPVLGSSATIAEVLELAGAAAELIQTLTAPEIESFLSAFQHTLATPLSVSLDEAAAELWSAELDQLLGEKAAEVVDQVVNTLGTSLETALWDTVDLLAGSSSPELPASMKRKFNGVTLTDLGSSLVGDALLEAVATRHSLAVAFAILTMALLTSDSDAAGLANIPTFVAHAFSILQSLNALYELARTPGFPEMPVVSHDEADRDSISARLGRLNVDREGDKDGDDQTTRQFEAPSLLHFCVRHQLLNVASDTDELEQETGGTEISDQIASAARLALQASDLFRSTSSVVPGSTASASLVLPILSAGQAVLADALLRHGFPSASLAFLSHFPPTPASSYVQARALVYLQRLQEASDAFERVLPGIESSSVGSPRKPDGLAAMLPSSVTNVEATEPVSQYYRHVASFFEAADAPFFIVKFCQASIESVTSFSGGVSVEEAESTTRDLWFKIFRAQLELGDFVSAYSTIMAIPHEGLQRDCLRSLVGAMCEAGEIGTLLRFSFPGLQPEIERTLAFKARNSDPLAVPNYYLVLYSYHIFRGDLKSAGAVMYQHAHRLADLHASGGARLGLNADPVAEYMDLAVRQAQSYLASINALSMIKHENAWFAHATSSPAELEAEQARSNFFGAEPETGARTTASWSSGQKLTQYIPSEMFNRAAREIRIVGLDDIRKEYALVLARLELVGRYPELGYSTSTLRPADAVLLFVNSDRFDLAFWTAKSLDVDMSPIFSNLTTKCVALTQAKALRPADPLASGEVRADAEMEELRDADEDLEEPEAAFLALSEKSASWTGPASERAWRFVRMHLDMFDSERVCWRYRLAVLDRAVSLGQAEKLPDWLQKWFEEHKPDLLVRALMRYGLVDAALRQSVRMIAKENTRLKHSTQAGSSWLPYSLFDELLLQAEDPDARPASASSATTTRGLAADLRAALADRIAKLEKRTNEVKRMGEADLERERKRRERDEREWVPAA